MSCCLTLRQERHRFMKKLKIYSLYEEMNLFESSNSNNDETDDID